MRRRARYRWHRKPGLGRRALAGIHARCLERMHGFDDMAAQMRELVNAAGDVATAALLYQRGVRTFGDAERAIATGMKDLQPARREYVSTVSAIEAGRLQRKRRD